MPPHGSHIVANMDTSAVHGFAKVLETDTLCDRAEANKWLSRTHVELVRHTIQLAFVARSDGSTTEGASLGGEGYPGQVPPTAHKTRRASCVCLSSPS